MRVSVCLLAMGLVASVFADVVLENAAFRLTVGDDAVAKSLVIKANGEDCLDNREGLPLFETVQERPFNNETKLAHPNRRMSYPANRIRREGDLLYVGFETAPYTAVIRVRETDGYVAFTLEDLVSDPEDERQYRGLVMDAPPVAAFRLLQLSVRDRANFGEWVNAAWDERAAVGVMGTDPLVDVNSFRRKGRHDLTADLVSGMKLRGGTAAIVAGAGPDAFLGGVERLEDDFNLPKGVASRRDPRLNASVLWVGDLTPANVDRYIEIAKRGGFRMMLIYYKGICRIHPTDCYGTFGDYDWSADYPNGADDLKLVLGKIKAAGITPGFHTLQTHIGLRSRYVTPVADPRLNKKRLFTLAQPIAASGEVGEIAVEENPVDSPRHEKCRVLQFGGELFTYADYTTVRPYRFTGVRRGAHATRSVAHACGEIGGVLDVCEYTATSCYLDQRTSLQDEIAAKIARIGDLGMEFYYFDGSEGVNPPCNVNVSLSQFRVAKALAHPPLFTQGAAKSHFGWHLQSGGNAFDPFRPEVFKRKLAEHPLAEAPVMRRDFTRIDFGWWAVYVPVTDGDAGAKRKPTVGTQPDMWEYGTSKAAAWDCPATVQCWMNDVESHPRRDDLLETMRRWEDVRVRRWLTPAQKEMLKDPARQFHLYRNERGAYELHEIDMLTSEDAAGLRAFLFERDGRRVVAYWHTSGMGDFTLPLGKDGAKVTLQAAGVKYLTTDLSAEVVRSAFPSAPSVVRAAAPEKPAPVRRAVETTWSGPAELVCDDPRGWTFDVRAADDGGRDVVTVTISSPTNALPPRFGVFFRVPGAGVQNVWTSDCAKDGFHLWPQLWWDWIAKYSSQLARETPIAVGFNSQEVSPVALACSEALEDLVFGLYADDRTCEIVGRCEFFTKPTAARKTYSASVLLDRRGRRFAETVRACSKWVAERNGFRTADVPEAAFDPLYSTWYAYLQDVSADKLEKEAEIAASLGMKTMILDDGWQKAESRTFYSATGDWMPAASRFPDMKAHVAKVRKTGLKYMLWLSVPYMGSEAKNYPRFRKMLLCDGDVGVLDPRFPEVRDYLISTYERVVGEWGFDGVKLDFIDSFQPPKDDPALADGYAGRDCRSVPEAVDRLMKDVIVRLKRINPDVLIEFRQHYMGPAVLQYGNMMRCADCPADPCANRRRICDLRLTSGDLAVHSDMLVWSRDEPPEGAALPILNALFSTIQYSMVLADIRPDHKEVIRHWLAFTQKHRAALLKGEFRPHHPENGYTWIEGESPEERVIAVYSKDTCVPAGRADKPVFLVNATGSEGLIVEFDAPATVERFDTFGKPLGKTEIRNGLRRIAVPNAGWARVSW